MDCTSGRKVVASQHTKTIIKMSCPEVEPSDQEEQNLIMQLTARGLEYCQLIYGPAAVSGRIIDHTDGMMYSKFSTWTYSDPSPPSPGWKPGEITWKTDVHAAGRPHLQLQVYSHGANFDKWDTYFMRTVITYYIQHISGIRPGIRKVAWTKPDLDIRLVPTKTGVNVPPIDQLLLLNALLDFQQQHEARLVDFQMLSEGPVVAIGSLDPTNVRDWTLAATA